MSEDRQESTKDVTESADEIANQLEDALKNTDTVPDESTHKEADTGYAYADESGDGRKTGIYVAIAIVAAVLVFAGGLFALYMVFFSGGRHEDANEYFGIQGDESAVVVDGVVKKEKIISIDGQLYVPSSVSSSLNPRINIDKKAKILSYVCDYTDDVKGLLSDKSLPKGILRADAGEKKLKSYTYKDAADTAVTIDTDYVTLIEKDGSLYISMKFIDEFTLYKTWTSYDEPARLVITSDNSSGTYYTLKDDEDMRNGPGDKYAILTELSSGDVVMADSTTPEENGYAPVISQDGYKGYVKKENLSIGDGNAVKNDTNEDVLYFPQNAENTNVCLGWHQVTTKQAAKVLPQQIDTAKSMNVISPTWFSLKAGKGKFRSFANPGYVKKAHKKGKKVWPLINDFNVASKLKNILDSKKNRENLIKGLLKEAKRCDFDGINIDFEKINKKSAAGYLEFLRELSYACHANGLTLSVDDYPPRSYNSFYDISEQGKVADYLILMAYDEHYSGSDEAGSVSSLSYVKGGCQSMLRSVPNERLICGLPFYTRLWQTKKSGEVEASTAYGISGAENLIWSGSRGRKWDKTTGQYISSWRVGKKYFSIWLEEERSIQKKLDAIGKLKIAGVAFWKLGLEREATWNTINAWMH